MRGKPAGRRRWALLAAGVVLLSSLVGGARLLPWDGSAGSNRAQGSAPLSSVREFLGSSGSPGVTQELEWVNLDNVSGQPPVEVIRGDLAFDPNLDESVYFGGSGFPAWTDPSGNETWAFSGGAWSNVSTPFAPPATAWSEMDYDPALGALVLVDSSDAAYAASVSGSTWEYTSEGWAALDDGQNVTGSDFAAMAYDPTLPGLVRFGGQGPVLNDITDENEILNETQVLIGTTWGNVTGILSPPARYGATAAYDETLGGVVLYGGEGDNGVSNETWLFVDGVWRQLDPAKNPPALVYATSTWDPSLDGILMQGGDLGSGAVVSASHRAWLFHDGNWSAIAEPAMAPVVAESSCTYDPTVGGVLNVGGWGAAGNATGEVAVEGPLEEAWLTTLAPAVLPSVSPGPYEAGVPVWFGDRLSNDSPNEVANWSFGDGSEAAGANTSHRYAAAGTYTATLSASVATPGGASTTNANVSLEVVAALSAVARDPSSVADQEHPVRLSVGLSGGIAPFTVKWSFGDGTYATGSTSVTHAFRTTGNLTVTATAVDSLGVERNATFAVHVEPFAQVALSLPTTVLDLGQPLTVSVLARNGTEPYSYSYAGLPGGCVTANVSALTCTPTVTGQYGIVADLVDSDGISIESPEALVTIYPPLAGTLNVSTKVLDLGGSFTIATLMTSAASGDLTAFVPGGLGCSATEALAAVCTPVSAGQYPLSVTVTDRAGATLHLSAGPVTVHPVLNLSLMGPGEPVERGVPFYVTLDAIGGTLPYRFTDGGLPPGCGATNATVLRCYEGLDGQYELRATVSDAVGSVANASLTVQVAGAPIQTGPATPSAPPPSNGLADLWLWVVVAAALGEIILSWRYSHGRRARRLAAEKLLWSEPGSADPDAPDLDAERAEKSVSPDAGSFDPGPASLG